MQRSTVSVCPTIDKQIDAILAALEGMAEARASAAERARVAKDRHFKAGEAKGLRTAREFIREALKHGH